MAKQNVPTAQKSEDNIPVVTIPRAGLASGLGNIFLIIAILIAEAIAAYTIVALYYPDIYEFVYGEPPNYGVIYEFNDIVINPSASDGLRFLVISIGVQLNNTSSLVSVIRNEIIIKDAINSLLSQKSIEELQKVEARMNIKQEIGIVINNVLRDEAVRNVFFTKYVMQ